MVPSVQRVVSDRGTRPLYDGDAPVSSRGFAGVRLGHSQSFAHAIATELRPLTIAARNAVLGVLTS